MSNSTPSNRGTLNAAWPVRRRRRRRRRRPLALLRGHASLHRCWPSCAPSFRAVIEENLRRAQASEKYISKMQSIGFAYAADLCPRTIAATAPTPTPHTEIRMESTQLRYSLRQLRYFVVTAELLSFTAAAKQLHISQPSISTALADLETSFGVQLFIRHHASGLSLTQAGRDMLGRARDLLKNAEELQTAAKEMDGGMSEAITL